MCTPLLRADRASKGREETGSTHHLPSALAEGIVRTAAPRPVANLPFCSCDQAVNHNNKAHACYLP